LLLVMKVVAMWGRVDLLLLLFVRKWWPLLLLLNKGRERGGK
jgi:hypothetical protein